LNKNIDSRYAYFVFLNLKIFRYVKWSKAEKDTPPRKDKPKYSEDPCADFLHYLLFETNPKYNTITSSHNGGRYDIILMAGVAYKLPRPKIDFISKGNKIFQMALSRMKNVRIPKITAEDQEENGGKKKKKRKMKLRDKYMMLTNTKFRDSLCIIPVKLGKMIETLGLKDENGNPLTDKGIRIISFYKKYFQAIFPLKFYNKKIIIVFYPTIHR